MSTAIPGGQPSTVFLSHTDREEGDRRATTAILVELRRVGLGVWIDREHPAPDSQPGDEAAGPTPENPLFQHIVSALSACHAVVFVTSPTSLEREYVRLEFDPRILFQEFLSSHPGMEPDDVPFYVALVAPVVDPPDIWAWLTAVSRRVLNLTGAGPTPLLLPTVLLSLVRDVAPEHLLPLDPLAEWAVRLRLEQDADQAPGCPDGMAPSEWRHLEGLLGLGPLFPGPLDDLDDDQLRYGIFRAGDTARFATAFPGPGSPVSSLIPRWTANMMLRSRGLRVWDGVDLAAEQILPGAVRHAEEASDGDRSDAAAAMLQLGYALLSSDTARDVEHARASLAKSRDAFFELGAIPLFALAEVLRSRSVGKAPSSEAVQALESLECDSGDEDLRRLHHCVLDAAFPAPRIEALPADRAGARAFMSSLHEAASALRSNFARRGEERFNPDFWEEATPEG
jgi:hypothetical protein